RTTLSRAGFLFCVECPAFYRRKFDPLATYFFSPSCAGLTRASSQRCQFALDGRVKPGHEESLRFGLSCVPRQILDRRLLAGERVVRIPYIAKGFEAHAACVDHKQPSDEPFAEADNRANNFKRCKAPC